MQAQQHLYAGRIVTDWAVKPDVTCKTRWLGRHGAVADGTTSGSLECEALHMIDVNQVTKVDARHKLMHVVKSLSKWP